MYRKYLNNKTYEKAYTNDTLVQRAYFVLAFFIGHTRFVHPNGAKTLDYTIQNRLQVEKAAVKSAKN
jgi:hypothetical protein